MPAEVRWALSEEQLKARGVDVVLLRQGVHLQLAGNGYRGNSLKWENFRGPQDFLLTDSYCT